MPYRFEWSAVLAPDALRLLAAGLAVTVVLALVSGGLAVALAVAVETARLTRPRLGRWVAAYIALFRGVPPLLAVFFFSFALPLALPEPLRAPLFFENPLAATLLRLTGIHPLYFAALVAALALNTSAYLAEILRAAVGSVAIGQEDAGLATGLGRGAVLWDILLPQAVLLSLPALVARLIHNLRNTSLAVFVPVPDLFSAVQTGASRTFRAPEFLLAGAVLYLGLSWSVALLTEMVARRRATWAPDVVAELEWRA